MPFACSVAACTVDCDINGRRRVWGESEFAWELEKSGHDVACVAGWLPFGRRCVSGFRELREGQRYTTKNTKELPALMANLLSSPSLYVASFSMAASYLLAVWTRGKM